MTFYFYLPDHIYQIINYQIFFRFIILDKTSLVKT